VNVRVFETKLCVRQAVSGGRRVQRRELAPIVLEEARRIQAPKPRWSREWWFMLGGDLSRLWLVMVMFAYVVYLFRGTVLGLVACTVVFVMSMAQATTKVRARRIRNAHRAEILNRDLSVSS